jgi:hypothetical protein
MNPSAGNRSHRPPALGSVNDNRPARNRIRPGAWVAHVVKRPERREWGYRTPDPDAGRSSSTR